MHSPATRTLLPSLFADIHPVGYHSNDKGILTAMLQHAFPTRTLPPSLFADIHPVGYHDPNDKGILLVKMRRGQASVGPFESDAAPVLGRPPATHVHMQMDCECSWSWAVSGLRLA